MDIVDFGHSRLWALCIHWFGMSFNQPGVLFLLFLLKSSVKVMKCIVLLVLAAELLYFLNVTFASKTPGQACYERVRMLIGDENMNRWQTFVVQISCLLMYARSEPCRQWGCVCIPLCCSSQSIWLVCKRVPSTGKIAIEYHKIKLCPEMHENNALSDIKHCILLTVSPYIWFE